MRKNTYAQWKFLWTYKKEKLDLYNSTIPFLFICAIEFSKKTYIVFIYIYWIKIFLKWINLKNALKNTIWFAQIIIII